MEKKYSCIYRLKNKKEIQHVFRDGNKVRLSHISCFTVGNSIETARLAVVIPKKIQRCAVARNSFKRRIREIFRQNRNILKGKDIIVLARPKIVEVKENNLTKQLQTNWQEFTRCLEK